MFVYFSIIPIAIKFGGVPTGVAIPPIEEANAMVSIKPVLYLYLLKLSPLSDVRVFKILIPIGNIMAVVAVLLNHIERR